MLVGALGLGALRGLSMRVWPSNGWVVRQGNAVTMALWLVSILVHFVAGAGGTHAGAAGLEGASFLLYLGLTLAMQGYVVHRRALPLWAQLGPDAGRPLQVQFTQGPGVFFTHLPLGGRRAASRDWHPPPIRRRSQRDRRRGGRGRRRAGTTRAPPAALSDSYTRRP